MGEEARDFHLGNEVIQRYGLRATEHEEFTRAGHEADDLA
jgi:hypothetical protein